MRRELVDRLVGRIAQETRLARAAQHPRARIAHHMLADGYRAMVSRMLLGGTGEQRQRGYTSAPNLAGRIKPTQGFLTDLVG